MPQLLVGAEASVRAGFRHTALFLLLLRRMSATRVKVDNEQDSCMHVTGGADAGRRTCNPALTVVSCW